MKLFDIAANWMLNSHPFFAAHRCTQSTGRRSPTPAQHAATILLRVIHEAKSKMPDKVGLGALHTMDYENSATWAWRFGWGIGGSEISCFLGRQAQRGPPIVAMGIGALDHPLLIHPNIDSETLTSEPFRMRRRIWIS